MTQETDETPSPAINQSNGSSEKWLKWLDVLAKLIGAIAIAAVTWIANNYESKMSATTLLDQREQAESNLRASLLHDLVEPIIGRSSQTKDIDPERERLLVELLTLNFHDHFEFKPLLVEVATRLNKERKEEGRQSLESVARRVADRQINMLSAVAATMQDKVELVSLFFKQSPSIPQALSSECDQSTEGQNKNDQPALFINGTASQSVCSYSPDKTYRLEISVVQADFERRTIRTSITISKENSTKEISSESSSNWIQSYDFTLTPFDFPLTDNTEINPNNRFALVLYQLPKKGGEKEEVILLKLIWFPKGYITERERPINYLEVRKILGMEETKR